MIVTIDGIQFPMYNEMNITLAYDSIADTFGCKVYFEPSNADHKKALRPLAYHKCIITHGGVLVMTATVLNNKFGSAGDPPKQLAIVEGYSQTGILGDNNLAYFQKSFPDQVPSQFDGLTLVQVAQKVCAPFNMAVKVSDDLQKDTAFNKPYPTLSNNDETQTIAEFLDHLCTAKNAVLSHTNKGELLITRTNASKIKTTKATYVREDVLSTATLDVYNDPGTVYESQTVDITDRPILYDFEDASLFLKSGSVGQHSWTEASLDVNGQNIHTYIHVVGQTQDPASGASINALDTMVNVLGTFINVTTAIGNQKLFQSHLRFRYEKQTSGDDNDSPQTARGILGDELKNIVLTFTIAGWTLNGNLITPNQLITVINPELYLYKKTTFFIKEVTLYGNEVLEVATITCVLVECFNNDDMSATNLTNKYPMF